MLQRTRLLLLSLALVCPVLRAQWQTTTYTLKGGWNAIYLSGDATYATIDTLLPNSGVTANIQEIWRWNPNPSPVQYTSSPQQPTQGTPEWSVWKRGVPTETTFSQLTGQSAYLVKCAGSAATTYTVDIKQSPLPPRNDWVRNGANLLGFPSFKNGASYPTFSSFFASFPAAIAANTKTYKYNGGDLGGSNPVQIFAPASEPVDRTQAYWFSSEVVGTFYGPLEIHASTSGGLAFGRTGTSVTLYVRNRSAAAVTLTLATVASEAAPLALTSHHGPVPLTRRVLNTTTLAWTETPLTGNVTEVIPAGATAELSLGINRADAAMSAAPATAFFASFLRLTDSTNLMDVLLPVTAAKTSLAGLWVGDILLSNVANQVSNPAHAKATAANGRVTELRVEGSGGFGYTSPPVVTIAPPPTAAGNTTATATAIVSGGAVTGFVITHPGAGYAIASPRVTIAPPPALADTETPREFPLRTLLHVADDGTARLLSQVYLGRLADVPHDAGLCTREALLLADAKADAQRLSAAHLPLDQVITAGSGAVVVPGTLVRTVTIPYNDPTNPFLHQYHPDHDNKDPRGNPLPAGVESHSITRTCHFNFTSTPPSGVAPTPGWGSTVLGGTYNEILTGIHKRPVEMSGTFVLRRASELGTLHQ